jgi:transposase
MLDEVHFQQHGTSCQMWIPPEVKDPVLLHAPTRKSVGYFGAVRLRDGRFVWSREMESFDGQTFATFLKKLRRKAICSQKKVVVILDNARFHHAKLHKEWRESCQEYFTLVFLPPYSPELNTIERTWKLTRRLCTHNRYFATLNEVITAVETQFQQWSSPNRQLRLLCSFT